MDEQQITETLATKVHGWRVQEFGAEDQIAWVSGERCLQCWVKNYMPTENDSQAINTANAWLARLDKNVETGYWGLSRGTGDEKAYAEIIVAEKDKTERVYLGEHESEAMALCIAMAKALEGEVHESVH